jgi:uncharacterized protein YraI
MFRVITLAGALCLGLALPTLAEAGFTTGFVNIRSGPGTAHPVVWVAKPGVPFTVHNCVRNWCNISYLAINGWISAANINRH